ncbi:globin domain-containing protein [Streptomyces sp. NPDC005279]|uniref:globin domain-containing protein n=1 Tax=Streptomyces sp. NPDC005279 TaxID=3364712 RepID=UPI0036B0932F
MGDRGPTVPESPFAALPGALEPEDVALIRTSLSVLEPQAAEMAVYFYAILFMRYPEVRDLFPPEMDVQRDRLLRALLRIVDLVDHPDHLVQFCSRLGRDHRKFGTLNAHYGAVGECLLDSLARFAGPAWSPALASAWERAYTAASRTMMLAADDDARLRPAVWNAQVVGHRQLGHGLAEITVLPAPEYPYIAGQYASVETPWWPKEWRNYSPANAPRPDSTLTFHVRAVPGGRVSNALVHQARPGDLLHLGPPEGHMTLSADSRRDLLCVAGGTGLAPIKALIEQIAADHTERRVDLFVGARTAQELYGLDHMLRMSQRHHWLSVRAAVSHERIPGTEGNLPEVISQFGPWDRHDVFLSGPPGMITAATAVLLGRGAPPSRIHHDPLDVPVLSAPLQRTHTSEEVTDLP